MSVSPLAWVPAVLVLLVRVLQALFFPSSLAQVALSGWSAALALLVWVLQALLAPSSVSSPSSSSPISELLRKSMFFAFIG